MPEQGGYYRTSAKDAAARTARITERQRVAATPAGRRVTAKRLAGNKAAARAQMTPQERHSADRREQEAFTAKQTTADRISTTRKPAPPPKPKTPAEKHSERARERLKRLTPFQSLTDALMGKKK